MSAFTQTLSATVSATVTLKRACTHLAAAHSAATVSLLHAGAKKLASSLTPGASIGNPYCAAVLADSPLMYWPLDETSGTVAVDLTGHGYTGTYPTDGRVTLGGSTLQTTPAVYFTDDTAAAPTTTNATDRPGIPFDVSPGGLVTQPADGTIEYWCLPYKPASTGPGGANSTWATIFLGVLYWGSADGNRPYIFSDLALTQDVSAILGGSTTYNNSLVGWEVYEYTTGGVYCDTPDGIPTSDPPVTYDAWHHVAITWSGDVSSAAIYIDGVFLTTPLFMAAWAAQSGSIVAGAIGGTPPASWPEGYYGGLAHVAYYNHALTQSQVQTHFTTPMSGGSGGNTLGRAVSSVRAAALGVTGAITRAAQHLLAGTQPLGFPNHYQSTILADAPTAYWPLAEDSAPFADASGNGYALDSVTGSVAPGGPAPFPGSSPSCSFSGAGSLQSSSAPAGVAPGGDWTIEAWVRPTMPDLTWGSWFYYGTSDESGYIAADIRYDPSSVNQIEAYTTTSPGTIITPELRGSWHHLVFVGTAGLIAAYVDGVLIAPYVAFTSTDAAPASPIFSIGDIHGWNEQWQGGLAHVAFYNAALTSDLVAAHFASATSAPDGTVPFLQRETTHGVRGALSVLSTALTTRYLIAVVIRAVLAAARRGLRLLSSARPAVLLAARRTFLFTAPIPKGSPVLLTPQGAADLTLAPDERNLGYVLDLANAIPDGMALSSVRAECLARPQGLTWSDATDVTDDFVESVSIASPTTVRLIVGRGNQTVATVYRCTVLASMDNTPATTQAVYFDLTCVL